MDMKEVPSISLYYIHIGRVRRSQRGVMYTNPPSVAADPLLMSTWCSLLPLTTLYSELMGDHMTCDYIIPEGSSHYIVATN